MGDDVRYISADVAEILWFLMSCGIVLVSFWALIKYA